MAKKTTLLSDFDGTFMDTTNIIMESWQHTYRTLTGSEGDEDYIFSTFGSILSESMKKAFPDVPEEESVEIYRSFHRDHFLEMINIYPGMKEMFLEAKARGYKTAIVTSRLERTTMMAVRHFALEECFDEIITVADCTKFKPDPQPIEIALKRLGSEPYQALMVGDTLLDMHCARNAGVEFAMVEWAPSLDPHELSGADVPEHIVGKADDILNLL